MFQKLLIANRGEIACRVIATARRLGLRTVAVHSDADANARHVLMADEAVRIGPPAPAESYLKAEAILEAARRTGAEAIHPGYGFLSENPDFVEAVEAAGLLFVGPPAQAIRAMGLKDAAKAIAEKAGVPVVPGYHGADQDPDRLAAKAEAIGWPVLIKASAGGGGKGMRRVDDPAGFREALGAAQREALAAFGDGRVLVEKYVTHPRHIEIQLFADAHGNVVHLFERDCSLQRRHQKVIEEAPAPGMPEAVRTALGRSAVELARAIGYRGAGTVEFIADASGGLQADRIWFMEMNTRLQVEHPVSEAITGLDFVEIQLRIAAGEPLPFAQEDLAIDGHAIEARIYAEDAGKGFLPATGRLQTLAFPEGTAFTRGPVRIDSGVAAGDEITPHYDPMIAKLIVHAPTRAEAVRRLEAALSACRIAGVTTNTAFLAALARHAGFEGGAVDTGLITRDLADLTARPDPDRATLGLAAVAALGLLDGRDATDPWAALTGWRAWGPARHRVHLDGETGETAVDLTLLGKDRYLVTLDGTDPFEVEIMPAGDGAARIRAGGHLRRADWTATAHGVLVHVDGVGHAFRRIDPDDEAPEVGTGDHVRAPMPGLVTLLFAEAGASVLRGDRLLVLEAMKMEHALVAPRDGIVAEIRVAAGDQVEEGTLLVLLEAGDG